MNERSANDAAMAEAQVVAPSGAQGAPAGKLPFKELDYYVEVDRNAFAGRDADVQRILAHIQTRRLLVLYGKSGLGKTSLLRAGVFPILKEHGYTPVYMRTLENPLEELKEAIGKACEIDHSADFRKVLAEASANHSLILVFDQFEEFLIRFKEREKERMLFVREITNVLLDDKSSCRVVFSLREDFLAALNEFQRRLPELFNHALRLAPLTVFGAREAIIRPLKMNSIGHSERLIVRLVDELAGFDFDSARLQVTCAELCRSAGDDNYLDLDDFDRLSDDVELVQVEEQTSGIAVNPAKLVAPATVAGDKNSVLAGVFHYYVHNAVNQVGGSDTDQQLARLLLDRMITRQETKYALSVAELSNFDSSLDAANPSAAAHPETGRILLLLAGYPPVEMAPASGAQDVTAQVRARIDHFKEKEDAASRGRQLLRFEERGEDLWVEIIHECLVPEILKWLEKDKIFDDFRTARTYVTNGSSGDKWREATDRLLGKDLLEGLIKRSKDMLRLNAMQTEFVLRSTIRHGSKETAYWWQRYAKLAMEKDGPGISGVEILLGYLKDKDVEVRVRAADAALYCKDVEPNRKEEVKAARKEGVDNAVTQQLATMTFDTHEEELVRRAAGRSLAGLDSGLLIGLLGRNLKWLWAGKSELNLLGDLHDENNTGKLGWYWRYRARHHAEGRLHREMQSKYPGSTVVGVSAAVTAGLGWSFTVGWWIALWWAWTNAYESSPPYGPWYEGILGYVWWVFWTMVISVGKGYLASRSCLKAAALNRFAGAWGKPMRGPLSVSVAYLVISGIIVASYLFIEEEYEMAFFLGVALMGFPLIVSFFLRLAESWCRTHSEWPRAHFRWFLVAAGWLLLTPLIFLPMMVLMGLEAAGFILRITLRDVVPWLLAVGSFHSLSAFISVVVATRQMKFLEVPWLTRGPKPGSEEEPKRRSWSSSTLFGLGACCSILFAVFALGRHSSPFVPWKLRAVPNGSNVSITAAPLLTEYFEIDTGSDQPALVTLKTNGLRVSGLIPASEGGDESLYFSEKRRASGRISLAGGEGVLAASSERVEAKAPDSVAPSQRIRFLVKPPEENPKEIRVEFDWTGNPEEVFPVVELFAKDGNWLPLLPQFIPIDGTTWLAEPSSEPRSFRSLVVFEPDEAPRNLASLQRISSPEGRLGIRPAVGKGKATATLRSSMEFPSELIGTVRTATTAEVIAQADALAESEATRIEAVKLFLAVGEAGDRQAINLHRCAQMLLLGRGNLLKLSPGTAQEDFEALRKRVGRWASQQDFNRTSHASEVADALEELALYKEALEWHLKDPEASSLRKFKTIRKIGLAYAPDESKAFEELEKWRKDPSQSPAFPADFLRLERDLYTLAGKFKEALESQSKLIEREGPSPEGQREMIYARIRAGDVPGALEKANGVVASLREEVQSVMADIKGGDSWDPKDYQAAAAALNAAGRSVEALNAANSGINQLRDLNRMEPKLSGEFTAERAVAQSKLAENDGSWDRAREIWERALNYNPVLFRELLGMNPSREPLYRVVLEKTREWTPPEPVKAKE